MNSIIMSKVHTVLLVGLILVSLTAVFSGCSDDDDPLTSYPQGDGFRLEVRYDSVRVAPGGDCLLPLRIIPEVDLSGNVDLTVWCEQSVNIGLTDRSINVFHPVSEMRIRPDLDCDTLSYRLVIRGVHGSDTLLDSCRVRVVQWDPQVPVEALGKRDELLEWVKATYPDLENWDTVSWEAFRTYPQILVVEHVTFLTSEWEIRICYHVTIPPNDWSYICLRRRSEWETMLAARRESDGTVHEVPVSEYPDLWD